MFNADGTAGRETLNKRYVKMSAPHLKSYSAMSDSLNRERIALGLDGCHRDSLHMVGYVPHVPGIGNSTFNSEYIEIGATRCFTVEDHVSVFVMIKKPKGTAPAWFVGDGRYMFNLGFVVNDHLRGETLAWDIDDMEARYGNRSSMLNDDVITSTRVSIEALGHLYKKAGKKRHAKRMQALLDGVLSYQNLKYAYGSGHDSTDILITGYDD